MVKVRTGNVLVPDGSWTAWSGLLATGGSLAGYSGRYVQYMAVLGSDIINNVPTLNSVTINHVVYNSPGTLGGIATGNIGLRADVGVGQKANWKSITPSYNALVAGQGVKFRLRVANDDNGDNDLQAELNAASWYGPSGLVTASDMTNGIWTSNYFGASSGVAGDTNPANNNIVLPSNLQSTRAAEIMVRMQSSGGDTPTLNQVVISYDNLEAPINTSTTIFKTDGTTKLKDVNNADVNAGQSPTGGAWTNESSVKVVTSGLTCTGCGNFTSPYIEVEAKPVGTGFDGITGITIGAVDGSNVSTATLTNLTVSTGYHLQMRTKDAQGRVSGWTSYGTNAESVADFTVDQATPTGTVSINTGAQYATSGSVTLTNTSSDTGGSGLAQMQFSNDGTTWSGWETYSATKAWTLSAGDGAKTVYAQYKDNAGNISGQVQDSTQANFIAGVTKTNISVQSNGGATLGSASTTDTFQPGPEGVDTCYDDYNGAFYPNNTYILSGYDSESAFKKGFVRFDGPSAYAKSLTITSATIYLKGGNFSTFSLYPAASYWGEESTGGTLYNIPLGSKIGTYSGTNASSGINVTAAVQNMITNNNYGFVLAPDSAGPAFDNLSIFDSSDGSTPSLRPKLVVSYAPLSGPPYSISGTFESRILDSTLADPLYGKFSTSQIIPGTTGITYKIRGGDNLALSDAVAWASAPTISIGDAIPVSLQSKQYLQYQAIFTTSDNTKTPVLDDVFIDVKTKTSDSITVDSQAPTGTVSINTGNPTYATNKAVMLHLDPADTAPSSGLKDFQLSNDGVTWGTTTDTNGTVTDGGTWKTWNTNYTTGQAGYAWNLIKGNVDGGTDGTRKVYVKYRDNAGNVGGNYDGAWLSGRPGTEMANKQVYFVDMPYAKWGPWQSTCTGPQCEPHTSLDSLTRSTLVSDNNVDFSLYPARNACKVIGGRLPDKDEQAELFNSSSYYGITFAPSNYYWTSMQYNLYGALALATNLNTFGTFNLSVPSPFKCIRDSGFAVEPITVSITLDTATPVSTLSPNPATPNGDNTWYKTAKPTVAISASDTGSKVDKVSYKFDSDTAPYTEVTSANTDEPFVVNIDPANLSEGTHTLYYFATDKAGSPEIHKSQQFKIDIQSPSTSYAISPASPTGLNDWYVITAPSITLTGTDPNSGNNSGVATIYYQWTNVGGTPLAGSYFTYTAPIPAAQGDKTLHYYTKDIAGNVSAVSTQHIKFNAYVPDVPTGFRAPKTEATLNTIMLHWDAVTNDPTGITIHNLQRRKGFGAWAPITTGGCTALAGDAISCNDTSGLDTGFQYGYKIQAMDYAGNAGNWSGEIYGYTTDTVSPSAPSTVTATPCDGTLVTCPVGNNKGFSVKVAWSPSFDAGVGLSRYVVYRKTAPTDYLAATGWTVVGTVDGTSSPSNPVFYDNDGANDAFDGTDKTVASTRLNDSTSYYYRVVAFDTSITGNPSLLIDQNDQFANLTAIPGATPDVTAPTVPTDLVASAMGIDPNPASILPSDPAPRTEAILHQRLRLTWTASTDVKARSTDLTANTITYHIYRLNSGTGLYEQISTTTELSIYVDGLQDFTDYYFKVSSEDSSAAHNTSAQSASATKKTASSAVPTVPTEVTVISKKGNPSSDTTIGHEVTVTFFGSYAKNCDPTPNIRCLVRYEVYRSTTNYANDDDWLISGNSTKIAEITPRVKGNDRKISDNDTPYSVNDSGLNDATSYYYKVRALDNTPLDPDGGPYYSPMTAVTVGTLHQGWDITPDASAPTVPAGGLEVKVRDTHPNEVELRNIVTWKVLTATTVSKRNGVPDFAKYIVRRETYNPSTDVLISDDIVREEINMTVNYFTDVIGIAFADLKYKYYIQIQDNAGTNFVYPNTAVINPNFSNLSSREYSPDSIIPAKAKPILSNPVVVSNVSVASAEVSWTTDQDADSIVQFRPLGSTGEWMIDGRVERTMNHAVKLIGLTPNTAYEYQVISRNYLGNNIENIGTLPALETSGFNITFGGITSTTSTADISWTTNLDASSAFVEYQLQRKTGDEAQGGTAGVDPEVLKASSRNHRVIIKGLRSARTYTYKIKSISKDGYLSEYPGGEFATFTTRTFDSAQFTLTPSSSNVAERNITATTAQIVWQTENETTSWVDYSTTSGVYDNAAGNNDLVGTHVVVIEGLIPGTTYFYRVRVKDANEVEYTSQEYSFTAVLKPKISNMTVKDVTPYSVTVAWDTNVDTETIINWGKTTAYGEKRGKSGVSKVHELVIDKLDDNQEYHYQILAKDDAGNEVADTDKIVRTPLDTEGPKITGVKIDVLPMGESDNTSSVIVSWQTNKPATTLVEYDEGVIGGTYGKSSVEDTTLNNSHTVIIKGLTPASSYHYRLVSADKRMNKTVSQDYTFVTPSKEKSILQLILKSLEETFAWTKNLNQFFGNIGKRITGN